MVNWTHNGKEMLSHGDFTSDTVEGEDMKKCKKCRIEKDTRCFYRAKTNIDGMSGKCVVCTKGDNKNRFRTKKGVISRIYNSQLSVSRRRGHQLPSYTSRELYEWCMSTVEFHQIFNDWKSCGFRSELKPSIDRLDDYDGYHFGNIQILTWEENNQKNRDDTKSGKNKKKLKSIFQFNLDGDLIKMHDSIAIAGRETGANITHIVQNAQGNSNSCGGYLWRYTNDALAI